MASFNGPKLTNPIRTDVPETQEVLVALAKQDPTPISDIPVGAKRLYEVSSDKWQWRLYNGTSWVPVPFLQHNVDQLDGYHAAITPAANTVAVRNASGLLEDSITGNAATASSAATLSQTLPVNKGGTGAMTSEAARSNLGVPPASHASATTAHGAGNATQYGHVKLSDATDSLSGEGGGIAATPTAVRAAKDAADAAQSAADAAQSAADAAMAKASTVATGSAPGIVKPGTGVTVDAAGTLNVDTASTSKPGIVQLNNTVASTSSTQAATANAVNTAYELADKAYTEASSASSAAEEAVEIEGYWTGSGQFCIRFKNGLQICGALYWSDPINNGSTYTFLKPFKISPNFVGYANTNAAHQPQLTYISQTGFTVSDWAFNSTSKSGGWTCFGPWK